MMIMSEERSLAEMADTVETDDLVQDSTTEQLPEDFDLDAWIDGVRPTRKSVKLYPQGHLIARMEEIAVQIDSTPEGEDVDDLIGEFERTRAQFKTGIWFTVEKRSSEWVEKYRKDLRKRLNLKESKDDDETTLALHQLAEQIVSPEGITYDHLRKLGNNNEGELAKLLGTLKICNNELAESAGVLSRDFSGRRSDTTQD